MLADEKVDLYMPFFVSDYLTDTADLSIEEHGAYSMLLIHMWARGGSLPLDHPRLARLCRVDRETWERIWEVIEPYFTKTGGPPGITQKRLASELLKAQKRKADARTNGRKGGLRAAGKDKPPEPEDSDPTSDPGSDPASETVATLPATPAAPPPAKPEQNGTSPISNLQSPSGSPSPTPSPSPQTQIFVGLTPDGEGDEPEVSPEVQQVRDVFGHYRGYHPQAFPAPKADCKEAGLIRARLRDGYSVDALKKSIDGYHHSPFHQGENDRGRKYLSLGLMVRDGDHVTWGLEFAAQRAPPVRNEREMKTVRAADSWAERRRTQGQGRTQGGEP